MTRKESLITALAEQKNALEIKNAERERALKELAEKDEVYAKICQRTSLVGTRLAMSAIGGKTADFKKLADEMESLSEQKLSAEKANGIDKIKYECDLCHDSGYTEKGLCECVKKAASDLYLTELSKSLPIDSCTFENFDLSYYSGDAKKRMTNVFNAVRDFADNFSGKTHENLLFLGNTGLGKTHLSLAIVGEVAKRGFDVLYGSAYNLFATMETEHFDKHTNESYDYAVSCDLLVIDDLGGEFVSPYIQTLIYNIVNTRLLAGRPTVINTNLSMRDITDRYTPRVASRLIGEYKALGFMGNDIRQIKAMSK